MLIVTAQRHPVKMVGMNSSNPIDDSRTRRRQVRNDGLDGRHRIADDQRGSGELGLMGSRPVTQEAQRLVEILAVMLRSALAWEEEHGEDADAAESDDTSSLTRVPPGIHYPKEQPHLRLMKRGKEDERYNPDQDRREADYP